MKWTYFSSFCSVSAITVVICSESVSLEIVMRLLELSAGCIFRNCYWRKHPYYIRCHQTEGYQWFYSCSCCSKQFQFLGSKHNEIRFHTKCFLAFEQQYFTFLYRIVFIFWQLLYSAVLQLRLFLGSLFYAKLLRDLAASDCIKCNKMQ